MKEISLNWIFTILYCGSQLCVSSCAYKTQKEAIKNAETRISELISLDRRNGNAFSSELFSFKISLEDFNL